MFIENEQRFKEDILLKDVFFCNANHFLEQSQNNYDLIAAPSLVRLMGKSKIDLFQDWTIIKPSFSTGLYKKDLTLFYGISVVLLLWYIGVSFYTNVFQNQIEHQKDLVFSFD